MHGIVVFNTQSPLMNNLQFSPNNIKFMVLPVNDVQASDLVHKEFSIRSNNLESNFYHCTAEQLHHLANMSLLP